MGFEKYPCPNLIFTFGYTSDGSFCLARRADFTLLVGGESHFDQEGGGKAKEREYVGGRVIGDCSRVVVYVQGGGAVVSRISSATKYASWFSIDATSEIRFKALYANPAELRGTIAREFLAFSAHEDRVLCHQFEYQATQQLHLASLIVKIADSVTQIACTLMRIFNAH